MSSDMDTATSCCRLRGVRVRDAFAGLTTDEAAAAWVANAWRRNEDRRYASSMEARYFGLAVRHRCDADLAFRAACRIAYRRHAARMVQRTG